MPAVSKAQQRFMGMVRATQKGEMKNPSPEVQDAANSMKKKDAKDFASTKHKGLPEKKEVKEEDNYSQKKKELKKTAPPRNKRFKELHSGTNTAGNTDVNEMKGYGEERFCELCGKKEYREECSYGPKMWDMFTVKNFSKSVVVPGKATYEAKKIKKKLVEPQEKSTRKAATIHKDITLMPSSGIEKKMSEHSDWREELGEGSLHKWFKGSKSKDGKGGWVNVVTGGTCASDEPGEGTPKCVSSSKRASMNKSERLSASRRKKKADPGQQSKSGAAKPTYVATDKKKKKLKEAHYGKSVNKIPKELDAAVKMHKSQAERLRKSDEFKKDAGKTANKIPGQLDKAVALHTKQAKELRAAGVSEDKNCGCGQTPCKTYGKKKDDVNETYLRIQQRGKTYTIVLNWRGKTINTQMFFASFNKPSKSEVVKEIRKVYPNAIVLYYNPVMRDPTLPLLFAGEPNESG